MFQHQSLQPQLQSWISLCDQTEMQCKQVLTEKKNLKDAEDLRDRIYSQLPWFYLCRATPGQIKRYHDSKEDVESTKKILARAEEKEHKLKLNKKAVYNSMLEQDLNYKSAQAEVESRRSLLFKGRDALYAVQSAFRQVTDAISEKEHDVIMDIKDQQEGQSSGGGWRNFSVYWELDSAESKIINAKRAVLQFCENLQSELPEDAMRLQLTLSLVDENIDHPGCGNLADNTAYGTFLIQKMITIQCHLRELIVILSPIVARYDRQCEQAIAKQVQVKDSFSAKLAVYCEEHLTAGVGLRM